MKFGKFLRPSTRKISLGCGTPADTGAATGGAAAACADFLAKNRRRTEQIMGARMDADEEIIRLADIFAVAVHSTDPTRKQPIITGKQQEIFLSVLT